MYLVKIYTVSLHLYCFDSKMFVFTIKFGLLKNMTKNIFVGDLIVPKNKSTYEYIFYHNVC